MSRFLIHPDQIQGGRVTLTGDAYHHAIRVLRLGVGDRIIVFHEDAEYEAIIDHRDARRLEASLVAERPPLPAPPVALTVVQSVIKADRMDWVVEKCTELGVECLTPVAARRSVVVLSRLRANTRRSRWQRVAAAAAQQCGRRQPMTVAPLVPLARAVSEIGADLLLVPHERELRRSISDAVRKHRDACSIALVVGPEGGFAPDEVELLEAADGLLVSLGPRTLRSETAAIAGATAVLYETGGLEPAQ
jgi:16S rRNA (uracil1498-N3)-methyltransferase